MAKKQKLPTDLNKKAKSIVDIATGESDNTVSDEIKAAAAALGTGGAAAARRLRRPRTDRNVAEVEVGSAARGRPRDDLPPPRRHHGWWRGTRPMARGQEVVTSGTPHGFTIPHLGSTRAPTPERASPAADWR